MRFCMSWTSGLKIISFGNGKVTVVFDLFNYGLFILPQWFRSILFPCCTRIPRDPLLTPQLLRNSSAEEASFVQNGSSSKTQRTSICDDVSLMRTPVWLWSPCFNACASTMRAVKVSRIALILLEGVACLFCQGTPVAIALEINFLFWNSDVCYVHFHPILQ